MRYPLTCLLFIILFLPARQAAAQEKAPLISGDFQNLDFPQFARKIQSLTPYHFYFNPAQLDSLRIHCSVNNKTLPQVLDQVLTGTPFHYSIDGDNHVFITRGLTIRTDLPESLPAGGPTTATDSSVALVTPGAAGKR